MSGILQNCFRSVAALHTFTYKIRSSELQRIQIPEISHQTLSIIMQELLNAMTSLYNNIV